MRVTIDSRGVIESNYEEPTAVTIAGTLTATGQITSTTPLVPKYTDLYLWVDAISGSDSNSGTSATSPLATISGAFGKINEGYAGECIVRFASGTFVAPGTNLNIPNGARGPNAKTMILSGTMATISGNCGITAASAGSSATTPWTRGTITFDSTFGTPVQSSLRGCILVVSGVSDSVSGSYMIADNSGSIVTLVSTLTTTPSSGAIATIYKPVSTILQSGSTATSNGANNGGYYRLNGQGNLILTNNIIFSVATNAGTTGDVLWSWQGLNLVGTRTWFMYSDDTRRNRLNVYNCQIRGIATFTDRDFIAEYTSLLGSLGISQNPPSFYFGPAQGYLGLGPGATSTKTNAINSVTRSDFDFSRGIWQDTAWSVDHSKWQTTSISRYGSGGGDNFNHCRITYNTATHDSPLGLASGVDGDGMAFYNSQVSINTFSLTGSSTAAATTIPYLFFEHCDIKQLNNMTFTNRSSGAGIFKIVGSKGVNAASCTKLSGSNITGYGMILASGSIMLSTDAGSTTVLSGSTGEVLVGGNSSPSTWTNIAANGIASCTDFSASLPQFCRITKF